MATAIDTPFTDMTASQQEDVDWFSVEVKAEMEATAQRYGITVDALDAQLQAYIPEARTQREAIHIAAAIAATREQ